MLDKYRAAIAAHLRKYLPPAVTIYELGNSLDDAELQRLCLAAPGVGVELLGADCTRPESGRATNITSGDQATNNVALWTVTWKQAVDVSNVITWPELDDF